MLQALEITFGPQSYEGLRQRDQIRMDHAGRKRSEALARPQVGTRRAASDLNELGDLEYGPGIDSDW